MSKIILAIVKYKGEMIKVIIFYRIEGDITSLKT